MLVITTCDQPEYIHYTLENIQNIEYIHYTLKFRDKGRCIMLEDHGQVPYIFLSFLLFFKLIFMFGKVKKKIII